MIQDIGIRPGTRVEIDDVTYRYKEPLDGGHLMVGEADGQSRLVSNEDLARFYAEGRVRLLGVGRPNRYTKAPDLEPGEMLDMHERVRAFYVRAWDRARTSISHRAIKGFIERQAVRARREGFLWTPSSGAVIAWVRERGEADSRPDRAMRTRTGKVKHDSKWGKTTERAIYRSVAWFYAMDGRGKNEAHARLFEVIRRYNALCARRIPAWKNLPVPTYETLRLRIIKGLDLGTYTARYSGKRAHLYFGGTGPITAPHIRHTVMIDSTTADEWCGYREESLVPLGRPTVYYAVDVRSRMVIAFLWFGPPSLIGITQIVKRILIEWGRVENIFVDNTWEHRGASLKQSLDGAGINLVFAPIATPVYKLTVEKLVDNVNRAVFHKAPGGAVPMPVNLMRRFGLDPSKTVSATVEQIQRQVDHYANEVVPIRVNHGIGEKPGLVWKRETEMRRTQLVNDLPNLLASFGEVQVATLTREGVKLKDGLRFWDRAAVTNLLSDLAHTVPPAGQKKFSAKARVTVVVDPVDISHCHIWNPRTHKWVRLNNQHIKFGIECRTRWEYRQVKKWAEEENLAFSTEADQMKALWKLRTLISSTSPALLDKARKRQFALERGAAGRTIASGGVEAPLPTTGADCGLPGILTVPAQEILGDLLPQKRTRRGGARAIERQKTSAAARKAAEAARADADSVADASAAPPSIATPVATVRPGAPASGRPAAKPSKAPKGGAFDVFAAIDDDVLDADWVTGKSNKAGKDNR